MPFQQADHGIVPGLIRRLSGPDLQALAHVLFFFDLEQRRVSNDHQGGKDHPLPSAVQRGRSQALFLIDHAFQLNIKIVSLN